MDAVRTSGATEFAGRVNDRDPLFFLADETGGRALFNTNDIRPDLERMLEEDELRYELAFTPTNAGDGRVHRLRLEVTRPGLEIHHRRSYHAKTGSEHIADRVLATLYHGGEDNRHRLRLELSPAASEGREASVNLLVHIPFEDVVLLPEGEGSKGLITVFVGARNERGANLPIGEKTIPLAVGPGDLDREFLYTVALPLTRGHEWTVAVAVRDALAGETSYLSRRIELAEE